MQVLGATVARKTGFSEPTRNKSWLLPLHGHEGVSKLGRRAEEPARRAWIPGAWACADSGTDVDLRPSREGNERRKKSRRPMLCCTSSYLEEQERQPGSSLPVSGAGCWRQWGGYRRVLRVIEVSRGIESTKFSSDLNFGGGSASFWAPRLVPCGVVPGRFPGRPASSVPPVWLVRVPQPEAWDCKEG